MFGNTNFCKSAATETMMLIAVLSTIFCDRYRYILILPYSRCIKS